MEHDIALSCRRLAPVSHHCQKQPSYKYFLVLSVIMVFMLRNCWVWVSVCYWYGVVYLIHRANYFTMKVLHYAIPMLKKSAKSQMLALSDMRTVA